MSEQAAVTYKSSVPSIQYIFKDGRPAWFIDGLYKTSDSKKIEELDAEIKLGHPYFSHAAKEESTAVLDENDIVGSMRERIRQQIIEEEKAKVRAASDKARDMGNYTPPASINPVSSNDGPIALEASAIVNATEQSLQAEQVQTQAIPSASKGKLAELLAKNR